MKIGITERGDAAFNLNWKKWVIQGNPAVLITKQPHIFKITRSANCSSLDKTFR